MRPIWKMYWPNGCKMTVERMRNEQKSRMLNDETIRKINSEIEQNADAQEQAGLCKETAELKDWQWELMLQNESDNEDWG